MDLWMGKLFLKSLSSCIQDLKNRQHCVQRGYELGNIPRCICLHFMKLSSITLGKEEKWVYFKHMYYEFGFLSKANYDNGKIIQAPTHVYNEVMPQSKLVGC